LAEYKKYYKEIFFSETSKVKCQTEEKYIDAGTKGWEEEVRGQVDRKKKRRMEDNNRRLEDGKIKKNRKVEPR